MSKDHMTLTLVNSHLMQHFGVVVLMVLVLQWLPRHNRTTAILSSKKSRTGITGAAFFYPETLKESLYESILLGIIILVRLFTRIKK